MWFQKKMDLKRDCGILPLILFECKNSTRFSVATTILVVVITAEGFFIYINDYMQPIGVKLHRDFFGTNTW